MAKNWTREETFIALRIYCQTPFGQLHKSNKQIQEIAQLLGRTPSAVAMKACNLASFDPTQQARDIKGLKNASKLDRVVWEEFQNDSEKIADIAEELYQNLFAQGELSTGDVEPSHFPTDNTESTATVKIRRVQTFFRRTLLVSYQNSCALSKISNPNLLIASHIIPWKDCEARRADPRNGILLNPFYDRVFDKGLISFDEDYRLIVSKEIQRCDDNEFLSRNVINKEGQQLTLPIRFAPDPAALEFHREKVFVG